MWFCKKPGCDQLHNEKFDTCWSCGTDREGKATPGFVPEPESVVVPAKPLPKLDVISVIEDEFGVDFTADLGKKLVEKDELLTRLIHRLSRFYGNWMDQGKSHLELTKNRPLCIDSSSADRDWNKTLNRYKNHLFYLPGFAAPDPIAEVLFAPATLAEIVGHISKTDQFSKQMADALQLLAALAPASRAGDILLFPRPYIFTEVSHQERARKEMDSVDISVYMAAIDQALQGYPVQFAKQTDEAERLFANEVVGSVKVAGGFCSDLGLVPIAGNRVYHAIIKQDFESVKVRVDNETHRVASAASQFDVPGVDKATVQEILNIRNDKSIFDDFRTQFRKLINATANELPVDQEQFDVEYKKATADILKPEIKRLQDKTTSPALEKLVVPGAVTIGSGVIAYHLSGGMITPTTVAAVLMSGPSWVADGLRRSLEPGGRKARKLLQAYGVLIPPDA